MSAAESSGPSADRPGFDGIGVADASAHGLRVQVEHQTAPNLALAMSGIGVVRRIVVHNERATPLAGLAIEGRLDFGPRDGVSFTTRVAGPLAPGSATLVDVAEAARPATIRAFDEAIESRAGTIDVVVRVDDEPEAAVELSVPVRATAGNEFINHPELHAALAAFVRPNARALTPLLRAASDLLLKRTGSGALDGYQGGTERATRIAGAVYEAIRATGVTYTMPPASFEFTGQKVRTTDQVLADRFGTCIDLSVLYAAGLEAAGLSPVVILTRNHAFAGFTVVQAAEMLDGSAVVSEPNLVANLVESRLVVPVELTGISPGSKVDYRDAIELGRRYLRTDFDMVRTMIDVSKARLEGVLPMPVLAFERPPSVAAEAMVALPEDRPFVARSSLAGLDDSVRAERVRGRVEAVDDSPARFRSWKRDLLDLSLRNPLLNLPRSGRVVDLMVPGGMLGAVEDAVQQGHRIRLSPADGVDGLARVRGVRTASELDPAFLRTTFASSRALFAMVDGAQFGRRLTTLKRDAESLEQETGSSYLYLAIGSLVHLKPNGEEARAPLFLLPVKVSGGTLVQFGFQAQEGETAIPNLCLVQWLRSTKGVRLPALEEPPADDDGIAIDTAFAELRRQLAEERLPFRIDETASVAILKFSTFQIWRDLDDNWRTLLDSPIVEHLVERPGETFADPRAETPVEVDETTVRLPVPADGSQLRAIAMARAGRSFVLEGPPGTGKSQTITNLVAELLRAGRTVLFVAEKQAALEVVHERLQRAGLGGFTLQLHGDKQSIGSIRAQLKAAIETRASRPDPARQRDRARYAGIVAELGAHPARVHDANAAGLSLWTAYDQLLALGDGPAAVVPEAFLAEPGADAAGASVERWSLAASAILLRAGEPWLLAGAALADPAVPLEQRISALRDALPPLEGSLARLDAEPASAALLAELPPTGPLQDALTVLERARAGLAAAVVPSEEGPAWRGRVAEARNGIVDFRARHAQVLADLAPAAFVAADLGELRTRSASLDRARLFPGLRRRGVRRRLAELSVAPDFADRLPGDRLTAVLDAAIAAAGEAAMQHRSLAALPGVRMPDGWAVWSADALDRFDEAVAAAAAASRVEGLLGAGGVERLSRTVDPGLLGELTGAWHGWSTALGADALSFDAWVGEGRDWLAAARTSAPAWRADVDRGDALRPQRLAGLAAIAAELDRAGLADFARRLQGGAVPAEEAVGAYLRGVAAASVVERQRSRQLTDFDRERADALADEYVALGARVRGQVVDELRDELVSRRPFDPDRVIGEVAELKRQTERKRGGLAFRALAERYRRPLQSLAPCFLMSPGSVAHYLPADFRFDVVVFDEASQIRVSQSIGALGRGDSAVIVGDSKQMPPTRVMEVSASGAEQEIAETITVEDLESILDEAVESGLPREWLSWHYRSHDERLIAFSNSRYYEGRLVTLPSPRIAGTADPASARYGLEWRRVDGAFDRGGSRVNRVEAEAIVAEIGRRLADPVTRGQSIGVVTFNIQQRELVRDLLESSPDLQIQAALGRTDGEELFVKNLENVQGDERDVILFSLAFSKDPETGRLPLQFGPLILEGGERRLNVAITRARMRVVVFSSFDPVDLDLSRSSSRGLRDLRGWLEYAAGVGGGIDGPATSAESDRGRFVGELRAALAGRGLVVEEGVGLSRFKVDLAVRRPEDRSGWRVGVIADGPDWAALETVTDRDGAPTLLESIMRWPRIERVWLPAWLRDRDDALETIVAAVDAAGPFDPEGALDGEHAEALAATVVTERPDPAPAPAPDPEPSAPPEPPAPEPPAPERITRSLPGGAATSAAFSPFTPAPTSVVAAARVLDDPRLAAPAVLRYAREALEAEGPVEIDRLCRLVAARFGLTRVVQRRRDDILAALGDAFPRSEGGRFVWPEGIDPVAWTETARVADAATRPIGEISLQELGNGLVILLRGAFSLGEDEAVTELARAFGFARAAAVIRERLTAAIAEAERAGRVMRAAGRVALP